MGSLSGHGDLQMDSVAFEVKFDLRFETSNLNYPGNYVYVVLNTLFGCLRGHEGLQMTSEVATDLKFEISGLNNPCSSASLASELLYWTNLPVLLVSNCFFELNKMPSMSSNVP